MTESNDVEYVNISDLDVIYLSYDEPQKEEFWAKIRNIVPWAKRVDGVKGSDSAHKAAANCSETERFVVIDGDNLPDPNFFNQTLKIDRTNRNVQFRWRARNNINGLLYGNGGLSCWTKTHVLNMRTHENTDGSDNTLIEFCFDQNYWAMHDCWSVTYPHYSAKQAFRAGFREGVKLCTRSGKPPNSLEEFKTWIWPENQKNLSIWHNIGRDVENGWWAMYGARLGTYYLLLEKEWDYKVVRDFDQLNFIYENHKNDDEKNCIQLAKDLRNHCGLSIIEISDDVSAFFKIHTTVYRKNKGIMLKENGVNIEQLQ